MRFRSNKSDRDCTKMYILFIVRDLWNKIPARRTFLTPFGPTPVREIRLIAIWCGSDQTKVIAIAYKCWLLCQKWFKKGFACAQIHDTYNFGHSLMHEIIQVAIRCGSDPTKVIAIALKCIFYLFKEICEIKFLPGEPFSHPLAQLRCAKSDSLR